MIFRRKMERALRMQKELNGTVEPEEEKKEADNSDITWRERLELSGFALLYFLPICLAILLVMCLVAGMFLFFV